jgi:predicted DsbA family dithiol-disulfide isomerase
MHVQIVQDFICPWCRIGKINFDRAVERFAQERGEPVTVEWVPFLLDPVEKGTKEPFRKRLRERKGLSEEAVEGMFARVAAAGRAVGLDFRFDKIEVAVDAIPAHQLVALVSEQYQSALIDAIHDEYFERGGDIGEPSVLSAIAHEVGIPESAMERVRQAWDSSQVREELVSVVRQVQSMGVSGVPFFIFDGALAVNGAQPVDVLENAMHQARDLPAEAVAP